MFSPSLAWDSDLNVAGLNLLLECQPYPHDNYSVFMISIQANLYKQKMAQVLNLLKRAKLFFTEIATWTWKYKTSQWMLIVNKKDRIYLFVDHYFKDKKKISQLILLYRFNINYSEIEIYIVQYVKFRLEIYLILVIMYVNSAIKLSIF